MGGLRQPGYLTLLKHEIIGSVLEKRQFCLSIETCTLVCYTCKSIAEEMVDMYENQLSLQIW